MELCFYFGCIGFVIFKNMSLKKNKIIVIVLCLIGLVCIRAFEKSLFYDPFLQFFKSDYLTQEAPNFDLGKLIGNSFFRYSLNSVLSILVLVVLFGKKVLKFSALFYLSSLIIMLIIYIFLLFHLEKDFYMYFFYVRRFLIQPLFLLLLVPAFYYQNFLKKN